jgi:16S rRNA G966 N2-methylase RsmD
MLALVVQHNWVAADGLVVVERSRRTDPPAATGFSDTWVRTYGETSLLFYAR